MKKVSKLIEIVYAGSDSVKGTIIKNFGVGIYNKINTYSWMIMVNFEAFGMIEDECKEIEIEDFIIFDRKSAIVKGMDE